MLIVRFIPLALAAGLLVACAKAIGSPPPQGKPVSSLAGSEWGIEGSDLPFIQFGSKGEMTGNGGCNNFGGSYQINGSRLIIGPIMSTKKACIGPAMDTETQFFAALQKAHRFEASHKTLVIFDESNSEVLSLIRRDWD